MRSRYEEAERLKNSNSWGVVKHTIDPRKQRQEDLWELKANLVYKWSSKTARDG